MSELFPTVGDIVHYIDPEAVHRAAIVIHLFGDDARKVWLRVLQPGEHDYEQHWVDMGDTRETWHWPERSA